MLVCLPKPRSKSPHTANPLHQHIRLDSPLLKYRRAPRHIFSSNKFSYKKNKQKNVVLNKIKIEYFDWAKRRKQNGVKETRRGNARRNAKNMAKEKKKKYAQIAAQRETMRYYVRVCVCVCEWMLLQEWQYFRSIRKVLSALCIGKEENQHSVGTSVPVSDFYHISLL